MATLNRYHFTEQFLQQIKADLEKGTFNKFNKKYKPVADKGKIYINGKEVIPRKKVDEKLYEIFQKTESPLGIGNAHTWINENYIGISRKNIRDHLFSDPVYQKIQVRPPASKIDRSKHAKTEGKTSRATFPQYPNTLGIDLIAIGKDWLPESYRKTNKYIVVVVHKWSGYVFAELLGKHATSKVVLRHFKNILANANKLFGEVRNIDHDQGPEFKAEYADFLKLKHIRHNVLKKVHYVEKANSVLQRNITFISESHTLPKALQLAVEKMNATPNRTNRGKKPIDFTHFKTPFKMMDSLRDNSGRSGIAAKKFQKYKGGSRKPAVFKAKDEVQVIMKSMSRETGGIGYKSYKGATWSNPSKKKHVVLKKIGKKYKVSNVPYLITAEDMRIYIKPRRKVAKLKAKLPPRKVVSKRVQFKQLNEKYKKKAGNLAQKPKRNSASSRGNKTNKAK